MPTLVLNAVVYNLIYKYIIHIFVTTYMRFFLIIVFPFWFFHGMGPIVILIVSFSLLSHLNRIMCTAKVGKSGVFLEYSELVCIEVFACT